MAPGIEQILAQGGEIRGQKAQEEGVQQDEEEEQPLTDFPGKDTEALQAQFGFLKAQGHFHLPAAGIDADDLESALWGIGRFGGE